MRSLLVWLGVLGGSVGLGVGMYTFVVAPATDGMDVSGTTAAAPQPRPTVLHYKTKVVKDPPKKKIVDVPVPVAAESSEGGQAASYSGSAGGSGYGESGNDDGGNYSGSGESDDDNGGGYASGRESDSSDDDGGYASGSGGGESDGYEAESSSEATQQVAEQERESTQQAVEQQRESDKQSGEDHGDD